MQFFTISLTDFIYQIFLPFLLFYVLLYALLRKTEILGKSNTLNSLAAFSIAGLGVISIYQLGLEEYTVWIAGFTVLTIFFALFVFSTLNYSLKKAESYSSGEAFKSKEEKEFEKAKALAQQYYNNLMKAKTDQERLKAQAELFQIMPKLEECAKKANKDLSLELPWYPGLKAALQEAIKKQQGAK